MASPSIVHYLGGMTPDTSPRHSVASDAEGDAGRPNGTHGPPERKQMTLTGYANG